MIKYRLLRAADVDLDAIAEYTIARHGVQQARAYRDRLMQAFESIAAHPEIGSDQGQILPGLRRFIHESHAIYYRVGQNEIVVMRLLGPGQDPLSQIRRSGNL